MNNIKLNVQVFSENEMEDFEINLEDIELGEIETNKTLASNILKTTKMLVELTDEKTIYITDNIVTRPKFEINGGIKIAQKKGARLNEAKIFNLFFRFINRKFDGLNTTALMVRPKNSNEEWIILLPEDTKETIENEKKSFQKQVEKLLLQGSLDSDFHNIVVEGYKLLTVNERCAQTLMHEYGHILQWRMYDHLSVMADTEDEFIANQLIWFLESGYIYNVAKRLPNFNTLNPKDKVYYLKECLVEDFRIHLNSKYHNGKIILPNKYAYRGDFADSKLMWEGMNIMEQMLNPAIQGTVGKRQLKKVSSENELSIMKINDRLDELESRATWVPGTSKLTEQDILNDLQTLGVFYNKKEVAMV